MAVASVTIRPATGDSYPVEPEAPQRPVLECVECGTFISSESLAIHCDHCGTASLLRTDYGSRPLTIRGEPEQFLSYRDWLPFESRISLPSLRIGCINARSLGKSLGLENLWLIVSGYAPELGADLPTCTFKTLEAAGVLSRVLCYSDKTLILSSAGNAGCAVLELAANANVPAVVVVPESAAGTMQVNARVTAETSPVLIVLKQATYPDAIEFVSRLVSRLGDRVVREGGAFNVARRDAMGVPILRAIHEIGCVPDHYFQAVGSGTGAIAAHEAVLRHVASGTPGGAMRLHLVQNSPFTPMVDAWRRGTEIERLSQRDILDRISRACCTVLGNAAPPWAIRGGIRDILMESGGDMHAVDNAEVRTGQELISRYLGFEPCPEAGAAFAGLLQAVDAGEIGVSDRVVVHLTGGGWQRACRELNKRPYPITLRASVDDVDPACAVINRYLDRVADCCSPGAARARGLQDNQAGAFAARERVVR